MLHSADVAELVDAHDSKSCSLGSEGSIPSIGRTHLAFSKRLSFYFLMSKATGPKPPLSKIPDHFSPSITVVASRYNEECTDALINQLQITINQYLPNASIEVIRVFGAFEIPVSVEKILSSRKVDCIIAFGVIIQGETQHANLIGQSITHFLQQSAVTHQKPVIHEVLLVKNLEDAQKRCFSEEKNAGKEAAYAAISTLILFDQLNSDS